MAKKCVVVDVHNGTVMVDRSCVHRASKVEVVCSGTMMVERSCMRSLKG